MNKMAEAQEKKNQQNDNQQTTTEQPVRKKVKRRPARKQVTLEQAAAVKKQPEQNGQTYNVWYNKWAGGDRYDSSTQKEKSQTRCKIATDAGYTRADGGNNAYCCLYFARGCCPYGSECSFLHRLPPPQSTLPDASLDVFGREKHSDYRDDMGGVGSFSRQNRTLYIGRLREINKKTEDLVETNFQEWGEIERIRVLHGRGVAFVTYVSELSAQFAKEAMMCQSMVDEEVLNVRWATEDPNPAAKRSEHSRIVKIGSERIASKLNPELVEAVEALDRLEQCEKSEEQTMKRANERTDEDRSPDTKRLRHQSPPLPPASSEPTLPHPPPTIPPQIVPPTHHGLLSSEAIQGLRNLAASNLAHKNPHPISKPSPLVGLADYGSDEDSS
ncbi:hypothetical protein PSTG_06911 [Puccinia striiformis f. sp. tritici PST-78]|uniref:Pre-mRNA-splicing factor CWC2 n=1 Tax=Puccinia striiformis f. sp. tritici PST-78 TaxID=1165861 RepID=A0A0L0VKL5_9BASI|nr:hypothetical protein PSTG_06911 [Puccinia striiformis f. sp. tritici PST-78]